MRRFSAFSAFVILLAVSVDAFESVAQPSGDLGRIARGHNAALGQIPYIVRMHVNDGEDTRLCGAALIGSRWILTAAHWVKSAISVHVYLGSLSVDDAKVAYAVPISKIVVHPYFNNDFGYDIALLKIPPTAVCKEIAFVPLPKMERAYPSYENYVAQSSGWGIIDDQSTFATRLQWGHMKILTKAECAYIGIRDDELCTSRSPDWATTCAGDSGGPLVLEATGALIGIASTGDSDSCENGISAVFTRVTSYLDWIQSVSGISYE